MEMETVVMVVVAETSGTDGCAWIWWGATLAQLWIVSELLGFFHLRVSLGVLHDKIPYCNYSTT